jgi:tripartite ATP-independent transporter DctM subunit
MIELWIASGATLAMLLFLILGVPVAIALLAAGFGGLAMFGGIPLALAQLQSVPYSLSSQYAFAVVPTFILMGNLAMSGGMARELFDAADRWLGNLTGGQYLTTIVGSTGFAAASGSTLANASIFTKIALPEMLRLGYSRRIAGACIAAAGTLAAMIPPSVAMVVYGVATEQSIGKLMIAGIVPGIITALAYCALVILLVRLKPEIAPNKAGPSPLSEKLRALSGIWAVALVFLIIMGGIYTGSFSPSAAGAVGASATLVVLALRRRLTWKSLWSALLDAARITSMLFIIIIGGMLFSRMLVMSGVISHIVDFVLVMQLSPTMLLVAISIALLILGCFVDAISMMLVSLPFVFPLIQAAGIDPIWFGIIMIQLLELGAITPPIGLNLFVTMSASNGQLSAMDIAIGIIPFVVLNILLLALFILLPELILWLPNQVQ